jgi:hypothetical protein
VKSRRYGPNVDPIADIAILGGPDSQDLGSVDGYDNLVEPLEPIRITETSGASPAWLQKRSCPCVATHNGGRLWLSKANGGNTRRHVRFAHRAGRQLWHRLSGHQRCGPGQLHTSGGPNSRLTDDLPGGVFLRWPTVEGGPQIKPAGFAGEQEQDWLNEQAAGRPAASHARQRDCAR